MTHEDILQRDWYAILDASPSDCFQELKQKYQRLVLLKGRVSANRPRPRPHRTLVIGQLLKQCGWAQRCGRSAGRLQGEYRRPVTRVMEDTGSCVTLPRWRRTLK
ncbi:hypothetical protein ANANG_G00210080 [Anguilla anguilla]|uniref:Uncharacterized protein n=1 Tax=Anguilla anguilla TaxID=7936 RepID=A0A9D3M342_ANGAN|nr:hypothetical protein ANANG_G00210080 [Anguilla anguilla]